jgi:hypothetical protein
VSFYNQSDCPAYERLVDYVAELTLDRCEQKASRDLWYRFKDTCEYGEEEFREQLVLELWEKDEWRV